MYRQHFGLTHAPLGKECKELWNHDQLADLERQFTWLLKSLDLIINSRARTRKNSGTAQK